MDKASRFQSAGTVWADRAWAIYPAAHCWSEYSTTLMPIRAASLRV